MKALKNSMFLAFLVFLSYAFFNLLIGQGLLESLFLIEKLLLIGALYVLYIPIEIQKKVKTSFVIGVICAILISAISIISYVIDSGEFKFSVGDVITEVLITERVYLSFASVLSFVFSLDLIRQVTKREKLLLKLNMVIIIAFVLIISARMALISILLIAVINLLFLRKHKVLIYGTIFCILLLSATFALNKNLQNRFLYTDKKDSFIENFKKWEPRVEIWSCVFDMYNNGTVNENLFGYGSFNATKDELLGCYSGQIVDKTKREWFLKVRYNTHNQFFDFLLSIGMIGVLIFITLVTLIIYRNKHKRINLSLVIACVLLCLVENCFHRQIGVYLFGLVFILVTKKGVDTNYKRTNNA